MIKSLRVSGMMCYVYSPIEVLIMGQTGSIGMIARLEVFVS